MKFRKVAFLTLTAFICSGCSLLDMIENFFLPPTEETEPSHEQEKESPEEESKISKINL